MKLNRIFICLVVLAGCEDRSRRSNDTNESLDRVQAVLSKDETGVTKVRFTTASEAILTATCREPRVSLKNDLVDEWLPEIYPNNSAEPAYIDGNLYPGSIGALECDHAIDRPVNGFEKVIASTIYKKVGERALGEEGLLQISDATERGLTAETIVATYDTSTPVSVKIDFEYQFEGVTQTFSKEFSIE